MRDFTFKLPMRVIAALVGVPYEDMPQLQKWQGRLVQAVRPDARHGGRSWSRPNGFVSLRTQYYTELIAQRRAKPTDDLISALLRARRARTR